MLLKKITNYLLLFFVFLIPWQTRYIYQSGYLNGGAWEYGTFSVFGTQILLWLIIILFSLDKFRKKEFWQTILSKSHFKRYWKRLVFITIFLGFNFLNVFLSIDFNIAYQRWLWILGAMCLAIIVKSYKVYKVECLKLLLVFWLSGVTQAGLAIYQFFVQKVFACKWLGMASQNPMDGGVSVIAFGDERYLRAYGSFGWPNTLGAFLAVCLLVGLYILLKSRKPCSLFITIGQLVILTGLILSFSRGAWLAGLIGVIIIFVIARSSNSHLDDEAISLRTIADKSDCFVAAAPRNDRITTLLLTQFFYYLILILILIIALAPLFNARFDLNNQVEMTSYSEHSEQYFQAKNLFGSYDFWNKNLWLGFGQGTYTLNLYNNDSSLASWKYQPAHNVYVLMLVETGLFGLLFYLFIILFLLYSIWKTNKLFFPIIAVMLIHGFFDHWWWTLHVGAVVWWVVCGIGITNNEKLVA